MTFAFFVFVFHVPSRSPVQVALGVDEELKLGAIRRVLFQALVLGSEETSTESVDRATARWLSLRLSLPESWFTDNWKPRTLLNQSKLEIFITAVCIELGARNDDVLALAASKLDGKSVRDIASSLSRPANPSPGNKTVRVVSSYQEEEEAAQRLTEALSKAVGEAAGGRQCVGPEDCPASLLEPAALAQAVLKATSGCSDELSAVETVRKNAKRDALLFKNFFQRTTLFIPF